ncbi:MmyB family transcriptional regulator [Streptomyces cellulosae]|uniref:MmyB-like transcription regulator ligand binding domain-containing protein n=1 Tax=Streptomyces cellulosae TaxID=1968 RepID=A0ABW7YFX2_STRCE
MSMVAVLSRVVRCSRSRPPTKATAAKVIAAWTIGRLRLLTGRRPDDAKLATLVGEPAIRSEPFRHLWATGDVWEKRWSVTRIVHAVVGALEFGYHMLTVPARPDRSLITYLPRLGSPTAEALGTLLSWGRQPTRRGRSGRSRRGIGVRWGDKLAKQRPVTGGSAARHAFTASAAPLGEVGAESGPPATRFASRSRAGRRPSVKPFS